MCVYLSQIVTHICQKAIFKHAPVDFSGALIPENPCFQILEYESMNFLKGTESAKRRLFRSMKWYLGIRESAFLYLEYCIKYTFLNFTILYSDWQEENKFNKKI